MKHVSQLLKYLIVLILLLGVTAYWYIRSQEETPKTEPPRPPVTVTRTRLMDLEQAITLGGHIEAESTLTVLPRVSGIIDELPVESGDFVRKGDLIAEIDPEALELQLKQAEAGFTSAKAAYERTARLYETNTATRQDYDQAKSQFEAYKSQYEQAKLQLRYATITSPMDGVILRRHSSTGSLVSPEVPIVTLGSHDKLRIASRLPERYYDLFEEEQERMVVRVSRPDAYLAGNRNTIEAQITRISPFISAETKKFEVISRITNGAGPLRPGMYVHVSFVLEEQKQVPSLPIRVLTGRNELWFVEEETSQARKIVLEDPFVTDQWVSVPETYKDRLFIYEGQHFLREGQQVRIMGNRET